VQDFEFDLEPRFRRHLASRGFVLLVLGTIALIMGALNGNGPEVTAAVVLLPAAGLCGGLWAWRARFSARITREGIEVRRYFGVKRIPWSAVRDVEAYHYERANPVGVPAGRSGKSRNSEGGTKKVACVKIVRVSGRRIELPAPLVTRGQSDPYFDQKVRAIKAAREAVRTGSGFPAQPDQRF
jgi:Bacterial PH domain